MFKRVDKYEAEVVLEGFSFNNVGGETEYVVLDGDFNNTITIVDSDKDSICIFDRDIPKLITALQAAYLHKGEPV